MAEKRTPTEYPNLDYNDALNVLRTYAYMQIGGGQTITPEMFAGAGSSGQNLQYNPPDAMRQFERQISSMTPDQVRQNAIQIASQLTPEQRRAAAPSLEDVRPSPQVQHSPPLAPTVQLPGTEEGPAAMSPAEQSLRSQLDVARQEFGAKPKTLETLLDYQMTVNAIAATTLESMDFNTDPFGARSKTVMDLIQLEQGNISKRLELYYKMGADEAENTIRWATLNLSQSNAAEAAKQAALNYGLSLRQLEEISIPQLALQTARLYELEIPAARRRELIDVVRLAFDDQVQQFRNVTMLENISQYETSRRDSAMMAITNLKQGLAQFMADNARSIATAALQAGDQFLRMLPNIVTDDMMDRRLPGFEDNGPMAQMAARGGYTMPKYTYADTVRGYMDPFAPVQQLQQSLGAAQGAYPMPTLQDLAPPRESPGMNLMSDPFAYSPSPLVQGVLGTMPEYDWISREE